MSSLFLSLCVDAFSLLRLTHVSAMWNMYSVNEHTPLRPGCPWAVFVISSTSIRSVTRSRKSCLTAHSQLVLCLTVVFACVYAFLFLMHKLFVNFDLMITSWVWFCNRGTFVESGADRAVLLCNDWSQTKPLREDFNSPDECCVNLLSMSRAGWWEVLCALYTKYRHF